MLTRTLEPEYNDDPRETMLYDEMDHDAVNRQFIADLIAGGPVGPDILDMGTGTARIPILLCRELASVRVMAVDAAISMLEQAKVNIDIAAMLDRIQLEHDDVKSMEPFADAMFDTVVSNTILHHLPEPERAVAQSLRLVKPGGRLFHRDLMRPNSESEVEALVSLHAGDAPADAQQLLRQSLHAALTLEEACQLAIGLDLSATCVRATSDRHWTLDTVVS